MSEILGSGHSERPEGSEGLAQGPQTTASARRRRRYWPVAVGAVAVLTVGGAGLALGVMMGGGGTQPEDLMPANTLAFADIDLDPGADQKANLLRLLSSFPELREKLGDKEDVRNWLLAELFPDSTFDADELEEWVGERAGVGLSWEGAGSGPTLVVVAQVTDEGAATETLEQELDNDEFTFDRGYVIIAKDLTDAGIDEGQTAAEVAASAQSASLADSSAFTSAMDPLGDGIASVYYDGTKAQALIEDQIPMLAQMSQGSFALGPFGANAEGVTSGVVKVEPDAIAFDGYSTVSAEMSTTPTAIFAGLPDTTMFAVAFTGGGDSAARYWQTMLQQIESMSGLDSMTASEFSGSGAAGAFKREIARIEDRYNLELPEDVVTLLGDDAVIAVDGENFLMSPGAGLRSVTDPTAAADLADRLQPLVNELTGGFGVTIEGTDDGLVVASTPEYAQTLTEGSGNLLENPRVTEVLVDVDESSMVAWVDFDKIASLVTLTDADSAQNLEPISALGVTAGGAGDGWFVHARLSFDE